MNPVWWESRPPLQLALVDSGTHNAAREAASNYLDVIPDHPTVFSSGDPEVG